MRQNHQKLLQKLQKQLLKVEIIKHETELKLQEVQTQWTNLEQDGQEVGLKD